MMKFACWVISLNSESENTIKILSDLKDGGVDAKVFPAVDGRKSSPDLKLGEKVKVNKSLIFRNKELSSSQLGCYLSHLRAIDKAYNEGVEHLCLLEDDVALEPGFFEVLSEVVKLGSDKELVRLMGLRIRRRKIISGLLNEKYQLVRPLRGVAGTQGYVINRKGMEKLLKHRGNIYEPIDIVYDHSFIYGIRVFGVEPHVIFELENPTSIKMSKREEDSLSFFHLMIYPFSKLLLSIWRKSYYFLHFFDFFPARNPVKNIGKTKRMH